VPTELARALPVATSRDAYEEAVDLLMDLSRPAEALELADSGRARAFVDLLNESQIDVRSRLTDEERSREQELKSRVAENRNRPPELARALGVLDEFYLDLRRSNPAYAELRRPASAKTDEIQRELAGDDTAFVEYLMGDARSHVWVVTNHGVNAAPLAARKRIEPLIASYRNLLGQPVTNLTPDYRTRLGRKQASELYRLLVAPVERYIGGKKRLIIVPDGGLANLPMESLIDSRGRYLLEEHTVVYSQSASASLTLGAMARKMPAPQPSVIVFGDPAYDRSSFAPIPYTREEAEGVARQFPPQQRELHLGLSAGEEALKREDLERFGYLHFAVHGLVDNGNPTRSGLALAHAPGSSEDGILRAAEIARLRMNAQLVVLSGCRTADGKLLQGEGLLAISRSFYYAGARAVVATLWNVDDVSTAELMKTFYSRIRAGKAPEDALRQAKIEMERGNHRLWKNPWFWSPFIISR
jgi:CHAT domain-containing protein